MSFKRIFVALMSLVTLSACGSGSGTSDTADETFTLLGSASSSSSVAGLTRDEPVGAGSPTELNISLYAVWLSPNADCSDPVLIDDYGDDPETFDLVSNPTLIAGTPPDGTYECMIMKMSDNIDFKADAEAVAAFPSCVDTDMEHTIDIYRADNGSNEDPWKDIDGNKIVASGTETSPSPDIGYIFASTDISALVNGGVASVNQTLELSDPIVVPGIATFVFDFTDQIVGYTDGNGNSFCGVEGPEMIVE